MGAKAVPIIKQIEEHKRIWRELWLTMADGDPIKYERIKRMDALSEFWVFLDYWTEKQQQKIKQHRDKNRQK